MENQWTCSHNDNYMTSWLVRIYSRYECAMGLGPLHTWEWEPWPLHFKHSHWWKRRTQSKFASHYVWGINIVSECKMGVKSTWIPTWHRMGHVSWSLGFFSKPPLGGRPNTKPGDHGTPNTHNCWLVSFTMREDPHEYKFIEIAFGWEPGHIWLHTTLEGPRPH